MNDLTAVQQDAPGLLETMAQRYGMEPVAYEVTIAQLAMPRKNGNADFTRAELVSCLLIANEHNLNPLTKEIYFMRTRSGQVQPIVSVDGWIKKLNEHPQFDGMEFEDEFDDAGEIKSCTCIIYRKDRTHPIKVTEYLDECKQTSDPWTKHKKRMLRHRTLTQGARYAVGFAGVMDRDEFDQWQGVQSAEVIPLTSVPSASDVPDVPDVPDLDIDQDPPLADEDGFITKLADDIALANNDADVIKEVAEHNADMIARCSVAGRERIEQMFEEAMR